MKKALLALTIGIIASAICVGTSSASFAGTSCEIMTAPFGNEKELIIQVDESNEKNLFEIRKNIEDFGGMRYIGYCSDLKVLLYVMDTDAHSDLNFLNTAFMNVAMGYRIKEGTIIDVQNACSMPDQIDPNNAQH